MTSDGSASYPNLSRSLEERVNTFSFSVPLSWNTGLSAEPLILSIVLLAAFSPAIFTAFPMSDASTSVIVIVSSMTFLFDTE